MAVTNQEIFNNAQTKAAALQADLDSAIADLEAAAAGYATFLVSQEGFDNNPTWAIDRGTALTMAGMGDLPLDRPTLSMPTFVFDPENYLPADLLTQYKYESNFFDTYLDPKLRAIIDTESAFIAQAVQDALFQQTRERDLQTLADALDAVDRQQARKGFPVPTGLFLAARNEIVKQHADKANDRNKEITALIAERAHDGRKHAIDAGIKMEDIRSRITMEFSRLYWQAADHLIRKYEADVKAELGRFNAEIDLLTKKIAVDSKAADFELEYEKLEHDREARRLGAALDEMKANLESWKQSANMTVEAAAKAAGFYAQALVGWAGQMNAVNYEDRT